MIETLAMTLTYTGVVTLALAMHRHQRQVWHRVLSGPAQILLRLAGILGLMASFAVCIWHSGWSVGPVLWLGMLSATGLAVIFLLTYRPHIVALLAPAALLLAVAIGSCVFAEANAGEAGRATVISPK